MQTRINKQGFKQMVIDQNSYAPNNINFFIYILFSLLIYCVIVYVKRVKLTFILV